MSSAPRKVVFVNRFFYPDESATSQMLTDLAVHLQREGRQVIVITGRRSMSQVSPLPSSATFEDIEIRRVWTTAERQGSLVSKFLAFITFYPSAFFAMFSVVRQGDVLIAKTDPPLISCAASMVARLRRARFVNWLQDLYPEVAVRLKTPLVKGLVARILTALRNRALRRADANVAIGHVMARQIEALGVPPSRVAVIPNWADETAILPKCSSDSLSRRDWGLADDLFVVGYSGNLGKAHEAATLIGAATLLKNRADIRFLFIGGGAESRKLQTQVDRLGLPNFVFRPYQPRELLSDSLAAPDAHWVSLRPELEGLIVPSKLYGILAAGRPVIAVTADDGEVGRTVHEHDCGIVAAPGRSRELANAIMKLADDAGLRERLGASARRAAEEHFAQHITLGRWSELLTRLGVPAISTVAAA